MNIIELMEGVEPKLPGAPKGIKIMTPQQFVANAGDEEVDEGRKKKRRSPSRIYGYFGYAGDNSAEGGDGGGGVLDS